MEEGMSKFDRRHMLKVMAATAAGGAAAAVTRVGGALPALADSTTPRPPLLPTSASATTGPRLATAAGAVYKVLDGLSDFNFRDSSTTWSQGGAAGSIYPISTAADFLWTNLHLPQGAILTEIILSVMVNDANQATWFFYRSTPSTAGSASLASGSISSRSATVQNVSAPIPPTTIDNSQNLYAMYYGFGTANNPGLHQLFGVRLGWLLNPGMTLFPNPRRVWDGFAQPTGPGLYGPIDATLKAATAGGGPSGVPAGAQAAFCAVQSYNAGVLTIYPDGTADTGQANWAATNDGPLNMSYMMVPLSAAGKFRFHAYFTGPKFFDVWGYLV
jgi:hypothetical protein